MPTLTTIVMLSGMGLLAPLPAEPLPDPLARGYLGIVVESGTMMIKEVEANSPAAKAGLLPGDVILRVGQLYPDNFEQVVTQVCNFRPGTRIELELRRGEQTVIVKVRLAVRPDRLGPPPGVWELQEPAEDK